MNNNDANNNKISNGSISSKDEYLNSGIDLGLSDDKLRAIFEYMVGAYCVFDTAGTIIYFNRSAERLFRKRQHDVTGKNLFALNLIQLQQIQKAKDIFEKSAEGSRVDGEQFNLIHDGGREVVIETSFFRIINNKKVYIICSARDITEYMLDLHELMNLRQNLEELVKEKTAQLQKLNAQLLNEITERKQAEEIIKQTDFVRAREQILKALAEKEALIKELHHRVKNNMQIISSLLRLQSQQIKDEETLEIFKMCQNRIKALSLIHEKLYRSDDFAHVNFMEYIESLVNNLVGAYGMDSSRISLVLDAGGVMIGMDEALPCGLIICELVSNSIKYAFPGMRRGRIEVTLNAHDNGQIMLMVRDDGIGLPDHFDMKSTTSLGLSLVGILAEEQLQGTITLDRSAGTAFYISFKQGEK